MAKRPSSSATIVPRRFHSGRPGALAVEPEVVGVPDLDVGAGERRAARAAHLALEEQRRAGLLVAHRQRGLGG